MKNVAKVALLSDGRYVWYEKRKSWGEGYYSFDEGSTWHRKITSAINFVREHGGKFDESGAENYVKRQGGKSSYTER